MHKRRFGFSLLELIMIVIILGILVSIALPRYIRAVERSIDKEAIANLQLNFADEVSRKVKEMADDKEENKEENNS